MSMAEKLSSRRTFLAGATLATASLVINPSQSAAAQLVRCENLGGNDHLVMYLQLSGESVYIIEIYDSSNNFYCDMYFDGIVQHPTNFMNCQKWVSTSSLSGCDWDVVMTTVIYATFTEADVDCPAAGC